MAAQMKGFKQGSSISSAVASLSMEPVFDHQRIKQELEDNIFNLPTLQASFGGPTTFSTNYLILISPRSPSQDSEANLPTPPSPCTIYVTTSSISTLLCAQPPLLCKSEFWLGQ